MGLDQSIWYTENDIKKEIYYRKMNWLRLWMINNTDLQPADNCVEVEVPITKIKKLIHDCEYVLTHKDEASTILPTMDGFFFGSTEYDEDYYNDVEYVKSTLQAITNLNTKITYEDCW